MSNPFQPQRVDGVDGVVVDVDEGVETEDGVVLEEAACVGVEGAGAIGGRDRLRGPTGGRCR